METDVRRYFRAYALRQKENSAAFTRTANELYRGGVTDMDALCRLLDKSPEELLRIRNIGEKSRALSRLVCKAYRLERGGTA